MRNITDEIYKLLVNEDEITIPDNVFKYVVPQNFHETTNNPIVRITPLPYTPEDYADDQQLSREYDYQIDIWWLQDEPYKQAEKLVFLLERMNFQAYYREPLYEIETFCFREIIRAKGRIFTFKN